jgi:hypothetical protein
MAKDYIPDRDPQFDEWLQNFKTQLVAIGPQVGLAASEVNAVKSATSTWVADYQAQIAAKNAARAATETKDNTREDAETTVRSVVKQLQANPQLTDAQRQLLGITVADTKPSVHSPDYILTVKPPLISLDFSQRQQVTIHFGPNPENERQNAKPEGVAGAKIWFHVVTPLPQEAKAKDMGKFLETLSYEEWHEWFFLADDTNSPYMHIVETNVPVTIEYKAQWFDTRMRLGSFGDPVKVTVTP